MADNLLEAWDYVVDQLALVGIDAIIDPRNIQPPCVLVEPPSITTVQSGTLVQLEFGISVIAPPPGNRDAIIGMLQLVDEVIAAVPVTAGSPGSYTAGPNELPAYNLTATVQIRRT